MTITYLGVHIYKGFGQKLHGFELEKNSKTTHFFLLDKEPVDSKFLSKYIVLLKFQKVTTNNIKLF